MSRDLTLDAIVDDGRFTGDDGSAWWAGGYQLVDGSTGRFLARETPELDRIGVIVTRVAGAGFKHEALQGDQFSPGRPLRLRPDPDNEHDPDAVGVWDAEGRAQAGWIPRQLAPRVAGSFGPASRSGRWCSASSAASPGAVNASTCRSSSPRSVRSP
jgi:hypothetical protein